MSRRRKVSGAEIQRRQHTHIWEDLQVELEWCPICGWVRPPTENDCLDIRPEETL